MADCANLTSTTLSCHDAVNGVAADPNRLHVFVDGEQARLLNVNFNKIAAALNALSAAPADTAFVARYNASPVLGTTAAVKAAVTSTALPQTITTGITNPDVPRTLTVTAGGTAGDIKAVQVVATGLDMAGNVITETFPAFTVNTPGTVQGVKAFASVTSILMPAHDGTGATTAVGLGDKLGLPHMLDANTVSQTFLNKVLEGTPPTVTVSTVSLSNNTVLLNSALDGSEVDVYYFALPQ